MTTSISKREVEEKDFTHIDEFLEIVKQFKEASNGRVIITFSGYDKDPREVYEIPEIREYVRLLFDRHPYLFYLLSPVNINNKIFYACLSDIEVVTLGEKKTVIQHAKNNTTTENILSYKYQDDLVKKIKQGIEDYIKAIQDVKTNPQEIIDLIFNSNIIDMLLNPVQDFKNTIDLYHTYSLFLQEFWKNYVEFYPIDYVLDYWSVKRILKTIEVYLLLTERTPYKDSSVIPYIHGKQSTNVFIIKDYLPCPKCKNTNLLFVKGVENNKLRKEWSEILVPDIQYHIDRETSVISEPIKHFSIPYDKKFDDVLCLKCGEKVKIK